MPGTLLQKRQPPDQDRLPAPEDAESATLAQEGVGAVFSKERKEKLRPRVRGRSGAGWGEDRSPRPVKPGARTELTC